MPDNIFKLLILGSGASSPSADHASPGCLLITPDSMALLDSGSGTMYRLSKAGYDLHKVDLVCYTHHHIDHTGDLLPILQGKKWDPRPDRTFKDFHILAPDSVIDFYHRSLDFFGSHAIGNDPERLSVVEHPMKEDSQFAFNDLKISAFRVNHTRDSLGYKIETSGTTIAYTGDMQFEGSNFDSVKQCDIFITECSFPNLDIPGHMNPLQLKELAKIVNAKRFIITHLYPGWNDEDMAPLNTFLNEDKRFILSHDFMEISLTSENAINIRTVRLKD